MNAWILVMVLFIIISLGGGIGAIIYYMLRPKMQTWTAKCYQLSSGITKRKVLKGGKWTGYNIRTQDLKPYTIDTLQYVEKKSGSIYRLKNQNISCNAVTSDVVDYWGKDKKEVQVLIIGSTATLLKKGYDTEQGEMLFKPMARENIDLVKSEIIIGTERYEQNKGLMQSIVPWIGVGAVCLTLVAIAYISADAQIKSSENLVLISEKVDELDKKIEEINQITGNDFGVKPTAPPQGNNNQPTAPPDIG